ncbi:hypothetical protein ACROYT_G014267 [Oculina patagonica]
MSDDESECEESNDELEWNESPDDVEVPAFTQRVGPTRAMPRNSSILDYFLLLFTTELLQLIVDNTNKYAFDTDLDGEMLGDFAPTSLNELKAFLGVVILIGIVKLPKISDYWSTDERFYQPGVAKVFSRDRFLQLMKYLHISDPTTLPERDDPDYKLYRVKPVIQALAQTFEQMYNPHRAQAIDEAMVKFKGRIGFLQYMPMKPCKRGIKIWCRCDSTNGYLCQFEVYIGKESETQVALLPGQAEGSIAATVRRLTRSLVGKNSYVFMDNFFSSISLFQELLREKIFCCGTLRKNRKGFPESLKTVKLKEQGESKFARSNNMVCTIWRDKASNKPVTILSTQCNPVGGDQVKRRKKRGAQWVDVMINRPNSVAFYNKFMGGVDMHDQARRYYNLTIKSVKWWKYLFWFFLDAAIVNSFIIYKESPDTSTLTHLDFRLKLSKELIGNHVSRKRAGRPRAQPVFADVLDHIYDRIVDKDKKALPCEACKAKNQRLKRANKKGGRPRESRDGCRGCQVILCKGSCFEEWHTNLGASQRNDDTETDE